MHNIGERLKQYRQAEGLSQRAFCDAVGGWTYSHLSVVEQGKSGFGVEALVRILETFPKLNVHWLLTGKGEMYLSDNKPLLSQSSSTLTPISSPEKRQNVVGAETYAQNGESSSNDFEQKTINERLNHVMETSDLSMKDFSGICDVPYRSMQNYLYGRNKINADVLASVCEELKISGTWLLTGKGNMRLTEIQPQPTSEEKAVAQQSKPSNRLDVDDPEVMHRLGDTLELVLKAVAKGKRADLPGEGDNIDLFIDMLRRVPEDFLLQVEKRILSKLDTEDQDAVIQQLRKKVKLESILLLTHSMESIIKRFEQELGED